MGGSTSPPAESTRTACQLVYVMLCFVCCTAPRAVLPALLQEANTKQVCLFAVLQQVMFAGGAAAADLIPSWAACYNACKQDAQAMQSAPRPTALMPVSNQPATCGTGHSMCAPAACPVAASSAAKPLVLASAGDTCTCSSSSASAAAGCHF
jgi:hypothetical protein